MSLVEFGKEIGSGSCSTSVNVGNPLFDGEQRLTIIFVRADSRHFAKDGH